MSTRWAAVCMGFHPNRCLWLWRIRGRVGVAVSRPGALTIHCGTPASAVVLSARHGQRGQGTTSIGRVLYVERLTAGSTATGKFVCDLPSKSLCHACWAANLSRRGELSFGWPRKWPISNEKWAVHFQNKSNRQLVSNIFFSFRDFKLH